MTGTETDRRRMDRGQADLYNHVSENGGGPVFWIGTTTSGGVARAFPSGMSDRNRGVMFFLYICDRPGEP